MHPQNLAEFFKVIHQAKETNATALTLKSKKLVLSYRISLIENTNKHDIQQYKDVLTFILKEWGLYTENEKKDFIQFLSHTTNPVIVKGILEYKINNNKFELARIYHRLKDIPGYSYLFLLHVVKEVLTLQTEKQKNERNNKFKLIPPGYKFNFRKDSFECIDHTSHNEFMKQVFSCKLQTIRLILSAQQLLDVNAIPHLYLLLKDKQDEFSFYENYSSILNILRARLRHINVEDVDIGYQLLLITEKQTYIESIINLSEPESDTIINESFSDIAGNELREQFITHLLSISTEKQKEAVKKQYLLNSKNIPCLIQFLIEKNNTTSELFLEACALCMADSIIKISTGLMDQHFLDNFSCLAHVEYGKINISHLLSYFSNQDHDILLSFFAELNKSHSCTEILGRRIEAIMELNISTEGLIFIKFPVSSPLKNRRSSFSQAYAILWNKLAPHELSDKQECVEEKPRDKSNSVSTSLSFNSHDGVQLPG